MADEKLTIERVIHGGESNMTLYRLSNGDIINVDEAVNYARQGRLQGIMVTKDERGQHVIRPAGHEYNQLN